jgi:hypothetical protein
MGGEFEIAALRLQAPLTPSLETADLDFEN